MWFYSFIFSVRGKACQSSNELNRAAETVKRECGTAIVIGVGSGELPGGVVVFIWTFLGTK